MPVPVVREGQRVTLCWVLTYVRGLAPSVSDLLSPTRRFTFTVPREYYLGYSWMGGSFHQGDYYSCAKIRIRGGPIQNSWKPIYVNNKNGKCDSAAGDLGQCRTEPCSRSSRWIRPDAWNGRTPAPLNRWQVNK